MSVEEYIEEFFKSGDLENILEMFNLLLDDEVPRENIHKIVRTFHFSQWNELSETVKMKACIFSFSQLTFILMATTRVIEDNPITLSHFPLIKLEPKWTHATDLNFISRMSAQTIMDTLEGLEWLMFHDVAVDDKSEEWKSQCIKLYGHLCDRIFFFVQKDLNKDIFNIEKFSKIISADLYKSSISNPKEEYGSDDDIAEDETAYDIDAQGNKRYFTEDERRAKKQKTHDILRGLDEFVVNVNDVCLFEVDTLIKSIEEGLLISKKPSVQSTFQCEEAILKFREYLCATLEEQGESAFLDFYSTCYCELAISKYHIRIFNRNRNKSIGKQHMQILLYKNNELVEKLPRSKNDIVINQINKNKQKIRLNTDMMFMFVAKTLCEKIICDFRDFFNTKNDIFIFKDVFDNSHKLVLKEENIIVRCASLTHAFIELRTYMRQTNRGNFIENEDFSIFDKYLF